MFTLQTKLVLGVALLALIGGLITVQHLTQRRLVATQAQLRTANAVIENEHKLRDIALADRRRSDETATALETQLAAIRNEPRITGVRICRAATPVSAEGRATASTESAIAGRVEGAPEANTDSIDVSDAVDAYATDCASIAETARAWQAWDAKRTH